MPVRFSLLAILIALAAAGLAQATSHPSTAVMAQREAGQAAARAEQLDRAAANAKGEAERARVEAEALIARIEASEARISGAEAQLRQIEAERAAQRARLEERQQPLIRLTAALQTMARRPPALTLVEPGSIEDAARLRALLASALPVVQHRTAAIRAQVAAGDKLRMEKEQALRSLAAGRNALREQRAALARLEESQLLRSENLARSALLQSDRSIALTEEGRFLEGQADRRAFEAKVLHDLATLPPPLPRPASEPPPPPRAAPYRLPVQGKVLTGFGEISDGGIHSRGILLQAAPNAPVTAPRAGRIVYAGRFRSYGQIVIVDHGGGWTSTITNLAALRVSKGDNVKAGDPLGRTRQDMPVGIELRRDGRPQPIVSFL